MDKELLDSDDRRRAFNLYIKLDVLKSRTRATEAVLVSRIDATAHIHIDLEQFCPIERRKLRQLSKQSERGRGEEILERGRCHIRASTRLRFIGLQHEPADATCHVEVPVETCNGTMHGFPMPCNIFALAFIYGAQPNKVDSICLLYPVHVFWAPSQPVTFVRRKDLKEPEQIRHASITFAPVPTLKSHRRDDRQSTSEVGERTLYGLPQPYASRRILVVQ